MRLAFPFVALNGDLAASSDPKLDAIKTIILVYKQECIRRPDFGNVRVMFRTINAEFVANYLRELQRELQLGLNDFNITLTADVLNSDLSSGLLNLSVYYDEKIYSVVI
jgi:hypothetical protein